MKNILNKSFLLLTFLWTSHLVAQDVKSIFNSSKTSIEFVGLDFSQAKLVGIDGFKNPAKIQDYYLDAWNSLFISEMDKYDIKRAFVKHEMDFDFSVVEERHQAIDFVNMVTNYTPKSFSKEDLQTIVSSYNTTASKSEFGLSFIVHSLNKYQEMAYIYVVIFDAKTKQVLFSKKLSGEAGGFGFRNYWARCVYNILEDIKDHHFKSWKYEVLAQEE